MNILQNLNMKYGEIMAERVKDFAVKLTADSKDFVTGINSALKSLKRVGKAVKNSFGAVDKGLKAATDAVLKEIKKITQIIEKGSSDRLKKKANELKESLQSDKISIEKKIKLINTFNKFLVNETKQTVKQVSTITRQAAQEKIPMKAFELDTTKFEGDIESVRQLTASLVTKNKETWFQIKNQTQRLMGENLGEVNSFCCA